MEFKYVKNKLQKTIKKSNSRNWGGLVQDEDNDRWGLGSNMQVNNFGQRNH